ncbi:MAG: hypothetical protein HQL88_00255 [Magnetococcales bacterium]|nr:hypothetical protein [Magnetococcales bacterium]
MFKKLQLNYHLLTIYGFSSFFMVLLVGYCLFLVYDYDEIIHTVDREQFPLSHAVTEIARHQLDQVLRFNEVLFYARIGDREKFEVSNEKYVQAGKRFGDEILEGRNIAQKGMEMAQSEAKLKEIDAIKTLLKGIEKSHGDFEHLGALLIRGIYQYDFLSKSESLASGDHATAEAEANKHMAFLKANLSQLEDEVRRLEGGIKDVMERVKQLPQNLAIDSARQREQTFHRVLSALFFALFGGLLLVVLIAKLHKERHLSKTRLMNQSLLLLSDRIGHLQNLFQLWEPASQRLEQLSGEQRDSLTPAVTTLEQLLLLADALHPMAEQMQTIISSEQQALEQAGLLIQQLNKGAEILLESATESGRAIRHLRDVTLQINLLATNASAEAFRSEATRSFAVFAEEIKVLARANVDVADAIANRSDDAVQQVRTDQLHTSQTRRRFLNVTELAKKGAELFDRMAAVIQQQSGILRTAQGSVLGTHQSLIANTSLLTQVKEARQGAQASLKSVQEAVGEWPGGA